MNIDYYDLCEHTGTRITDADHIARDVTTLLNAASTKKRALGLAQELRDNAVANGAYLRAFILDSAVRVLENEIEGEE